MNNMKLTEVNHSGTVRLDDKYDDTTADLCDYLLRDCGLQSEYDAGMRIDELRELALKLATALIEDGHTIDPLDLGLIDVQVDSVTTVRLSK